MAPCAAELVMELTSAIPTLAHAIHRIRCPVFLLTGLLGVLVNWLGRIVDRYRLVAQPAG